MKSIKFKIFSAILACCILVTAVISFISISYSRSSAENNSKEKLNLLCTNTDENFENKISTIEQSVNTLADISSNELDDLSKFKSDAQYVKDYQEKLEPIAEKFGDNTTGAMTFYIRFNPQYTSPTSGIFFSRNDKNNSFEKLTPTDFSQYDENDNEHVGWYYQPIKQNKPVWLDPYLNTNIDLSMVSYVVPLIKNGETIGVVGMDLDFNEIADVVKNTSVYKSGYAFLLTHDNKIISHPDLKINDNIDNSNFNSILKEIDTNKNTNQLYSYNYNDTEKLMSFRETSNGWKFIITVPKSEILEESKSLTLKIFTSVVLVLIIAAIVSIILGNIIAKPIQQITRIIEKASMLDLTYDSRNNYLLKYKDEIGSLSRAYEKMRKEFETLIRKISSISQTLNNQSISLNNIVQTSNDDITSIHEVVKKITSDVQETSASSEEISASIDEINSSITLLATKASESSNNAHDSKMHADSAKEKGSTYKTDIKNLYSDKKEAEIDALKKGKVVNDISILADTIAEISDQTNLLALNAAIESARAGESGKGFAVVSEEIRTLAEQSSKAVENIKNTITVVQNSFKNLSKNSIQVLNFMNENMESEISMINDLCNQYYNDSDFVSKLSNEIAAMSEELAATVTQVSEAIKITSDNAQKSSENVELIETSINETSNAIKEVSTAAKQQRNSSSELSEIINKFKIDNV